MQESTTLAIGGTASDGDILEEQKESRKKKAKADLESHGKYGRFEDEKLEDRIVDDSHDIHGKTSSSSISPDMGK